MSALRMPVRVLFLTHSFPRFAGDPVGSFVLRLAVALRDQDVRVSVVAPGGDGLVRREEFEGIAVRRFRYAPRALESLAYTGTMLAQVERSWPARGAMVGLLSAMMAAAAGESRRMAAQVLHAHWWFPGGLAAAAVAGVRGVPFVTTLHGSDIRAAHASPLAGRLFRGVMRRSGCVTTVSRWLAAEAAALAPGIEPQVAPMPVFAALFQPGTSRDRDRLLFVGKLNEQKGIDALLAALSRMHARPSLDVVAGVGSDVARARQGAEQLGVGERITWHPLLAQTALAELYRRATIFVAPMTGEGLGLVAVEAALSGMPVVAFASGGLTDIVAEGVTGTLVPSGDIDALAAALDAMLALPDQGAGMGEQGRAHALAAFAPDAVAERYADLYRSLVDREAPR